MLWEGGIHSPSASNPKLRLVELFPVRFFPEFLRHYRAIDVSNQACEHAPGAYLDETGHAFADQQPDGFRPAHRIWNLLVESFARLRAAPHFPSLPVIHQRN